MSDTSTSTVAPTFPATPSAKPAIFSPTPTPTPPEPSANPKTAFTVIAPTETPAIAPPPALTEEKADAAPDVSKWRIARTGTLTVVMVTTTGTAAKDNMNAVVLPSDASDLDVVEVHRAVESTGMDVAVYPNKGEMIGDLPMSDGTFNAKFAKGVSSAKPVTFRKMSKSLWVAVS